MAATTASSLAVDAACCDRCRGATTGDRPCWNQHARVLELAPSEMGTGGAATTYARSWTDRWRCYNRHAAVLRSARGNDAHCWRLLQPWMWTVSTSDNKCYNQHGDVVICAVDDVNRKFWKW